MTIEIVATEFADLDEDPTSQANYFGWDLEIRSGQTVYTARKYKHVDDVTFHGFHSPHDAAPHWRGGIPYGDPDFEAAVRGVMDLLAVTKVDVLTSNETGVAEAVDLGRIP